MNVQTSYKQNCQKDCVKKKKGAFEVYVYAWPVSEEKSYFSIILSNILYFL